MALMTCQLGISALVDWPTAMPVLISSGLLPRYKINSARLVPAGAGIGLPLAGFRGH